MFSFFGYFIVRTDEDQHRPKDSVKNVELATFLLCKVWSIISTLSTPNLKRNHGSRKITYTLNYAIKENIKIKKIPVYTRTKSRANKSRWTRPIINELTALILTNDKTLMFSRCPIVIG